MTSLTRFELKKYQVDFQNFYIKLIQRLNEKGVLYHSLGDDTSFIKLQIESLQVAKKSSFDKYNKLMEYLK